MIIPFLSIGWCRLSDQLTIPKGTNKPLFWAGPGYGICSIPLYSIIYHECFAYEFFLHRPTIRNFGHLCPGKKDRSASRTVSSVENIEKSTFFPKAPRCKKPLELPPKSLIHLKEPLSTEWCLFFCGTPTLPIHPILWRKWQLPPQGSQVLDGILLLQQLLVLISDLSLQLFDEFALIDDFRHWHWR